MTATASGRLLVVVPALSMLSACYLSHEVDQDAGLDAAAPDVGCVEERERAAAPFTVRRLLGRWPLLSPAGGFATVAPDGSRVAVQVPANDRPSLTVFDLVPACGVVGSVEVSSGDARWSSDSSGVGMDYRFFDRGWRSQVLFFDSRDALVPLPPLELGSITEIGLISVTPDVVQLLVSPADGTTEIRSYGRTSADVRHVLPGAALPGGDFEALWQVGTVPDGARVAIARVTNPLGGPPRGRIDVVDYDPVSGYRWRAGVDGSEIPTVGLGYAPVWDGSGTRLATYSRDGRRQELFVFSFDPAFGWTLARSGVVEGSPSGLLDVRIRADGSEALVLSCPDAAELTNCGVLLFEVVGDSLVERWSERPSYRGRDLCVEAADIAPNGDVVVFAFPCGVRLPPDPEAFLFLYERG